MPATSYLSTQHVSASWNAVQYHYFYYLAGHSVKITGLEKKLTFLSEEFWSGTPME